jgi:hypothetical protein
MGASTVAWTARSSTPDSAGLPSSTSALLDHNYTKSQQQQCWQGHPQDSVNSGSLKASNDQVNTAAQERKSEQPQSGSTSLTNTTCNYYYYFFYNLG